MKEKKVLFIRHAKSSWVDPYLDDIERPLNERGLRDAPQMGEALAHHLLGHRLYLIHSPAKRAKQTAQILASKLNIEQQQMMEYEPLYFGNGHSYMDVLQTVDESIQACLMVGHNPMLEWIAGQFNPPIFAEIPTCAVLMVNCSVSEWKSMQFFHMTLHKMLTPKTL